MQLEQHIEVNGVKVTLSFQASSEALKYLAEDALAACPEHELEELFLGSSEGMLELLGQAKQLLSSNLARQTYDKLRLELEE